MEHIKKFENYEHKGITYSHKWKMPLSELRENITNDVLDMALEITDLGYKVHVSGFTRTKGDAPYVWIGGKTSRNFRLEELNYFIDRLHSYFNELDFKTRESHLINQLYVSFEPKNELE
jgi:hypothetical protein